MIRAGCRWMPRCLAILSLVLFLLAGCSSGGGDGENANTATGFSRVTIQLDVADPSRQGATLRAAPSPQLRQTELITDIKIEATEAGVVLASVTCSLLDPSSSNTECTDNSTTENIIITVDLMLPTGSNPTITVTAFASGVPLYLGQATVTLDELQETVEIELNLLANLLITPPTVTVFEGDSATMTNADFTVILTTASDQTVSVDYRTEDGTAMAGTDYLATSGTLTFPPGTTSQTITVQVNGDNMDELDETFQVLLSNPVNAGIIMPLATGIIRNDDNQLSIDDVTVTEGNAGVTNAVFTVTLTSANGQPLTVTVNYATADGSAVAGLDYQSTSGTLTFDPGVTDQTIIVPVNGDTLDEINETFVVNLSNAANASILDGQGMGTIQDDDPPPILSITPASVVEGNSGTVNALFAVTLLAPSSLPVTVGFATADGSAVAGMDYQATSGTLTFDPGVTDQTITVPVNGDTLDEINETFVVNLSNAVNATLSASPQGVGTIQDDDPPPALSISPATVVEGNSGTVNALFAVTLLAPSSLPVTVDFATANGTAVAGSDYQATSGTLTFDPGVTDQTITVPVNGDTLDEINETFMVNLSNAVNATLPASPQGVGTIQDDDLPPPLSIDDVTVTEGNAGVTNAVFTVTLAAVSSLPVTVDFATADGSATLSDNDYVAIPTGTLTFLPGTTSQTITVQVNGDTNDEPDETFQVNLSNPNNTTILDGQGVGTIQNDDTPLSIDDVTVTEGNAGVTNAVFTVTLAAVSSLPVTVDFATADDTATLSDNDYVAIPTGTLTFAPGTTSQTITVQVNGDTNLNEAPDETFFVNLTNPVNATLATMQGMGTIVNDDFALYSVSPVDNCLREINPANASVTNSITITLPGGLAGNFVLDGASGLATDPQTGELWALLTLVDNSAEAVVEELAVINPATGEAISATPPPSMGNTNDQFAALAFDDAGTRYGLTDSFANVPNTLFMDILDPLSNLCTVTDLGGHALAYNSVDGLLYHATGGDGSTNNLLFESFTNPITVGGACSTTTSVNTTITDQAGALTHSPFANEFFLAAGFFPSDSLYRLTPAGVATPIGLLGGGNVSSKGLAFNGFSSGNDLCHFSLSVDNVTVTEGNTGTTNATFTVTLAAASSQMVTVEFSTADGTATVADNDYVAIPAATPLTVTFTPGVTSQMVTVQVVGDATPETFETFLVNLSNPTNAIIANGQGVGTILNDD